MAFDFPADRALCLLLRLFRATACAMVLCVAGGCGPGADELVRRAQHLESQGNLPAAIEALRQAVALRPADAGARLQLGLAQEKAGDVAAAESELRRALELGVPVARVLPHLGAVLLEMQRYRKLLDEISLPADMPSDELAVLIVQRGRAHLALGETADARTQFLTAARYRPVEARLGLALVAAVEGDLAGAEKLADTVIADSPASADAWLVRGDIRQQRGDDAGAGEAYRRALALEPRNVRAAASGALLLVRAGDYPAARALIERARQVRPADVAVNFARAVLALHEGHLAQCRESIDSVKKTVPAHPLTTILEAALLLATGQLEQSENMLAAYLGRYASDSYARKLLAGALLTKQLPDQALTVLTPILESHGGDPEVLALAGRSELQKGLPAAGRDRLQKAAALAPVNTRLRTELGLAQLALGDVQAATDEFRAAARADKGGFRSDLLLVATLLGRADPHAAQEAAGALEAKHPRAAVAWQVRGAATLALGDVKGARAAFEHALELDPAYFPAVAALARLEQASGATDSASARLNAFLDRNGGTHLQANLALAELEAAAGRLDEASSRLMLMLQLHPNDDSTSLMLAQLQLQSGLPRQAITSAQRVLSLGARNPVALDTLARAQRAAGDHAGAAATLVRLAGLYPDSAYPLLLLADAQLAAGQRTQAEAALAKAVKLDPDNLDVLAAMALGYLDTRQWDKARAMAGTLQRRYPRRALSYALEGDVLMGQRDYGAAATAFERAIAFEDAGELRVKWHQARSAADGVFAPEAGLLDWLRRNPRDARTRRYLAAAYLDGGRTREAAEHYDYLVQDNPRDAQALNNLAWSLNQLKDARALDYAERAYSEDPQNAPIADTLGWLLLERGRNARALELLTKALSLDPAVPAIRYHRAQALQAAGEVAEARLELKRVIEAAAGTEYAAKAADLLRRMGS